MDSSQAPATAAPALATSPRNEASCSACWDSKVSLEQLRQELQQFADERDWGQFHTPRNLLLALVGEVGELSELFQWRGEVQKGLPGFPNEDRQAVAEELSDVLLYLLRLSDACGIDLGRAALAKMQKNARKYPVDQCRGSSAKYSSYSQQLDQAAACGEPVVTDEEQGAGQPEGAS